MALTSTAKRPVQVIGAACAVYISWAVLSTPSLFASLLIFLLGLICGAALLVLSVVCVAYLLTAELRQDTTSTTDQSGPLTYDADFETGSRPGLEGPTVLPPPSSQPPHSFSWGCKYQGYIWTIPSTRFSKTDILPHWPPHTKGRRAVAKRWYATVGWGELLLQEADPPPHLPPGTLPRSVSVDLHSCHVRVVLECLSGRTMWMRKGPLELSHCEGGTILHGEPSFMLFAPDGAAKEQWYVALTRAVGQQGNTHTAEVQELYALYVAMLKARAPSMYPQLGDTLQAGAPQGPPGPSTAESPPKQRGWGVRPGGLWRRGQSSRDRPNKIRKASLDVNAVGSPEELLELHWHGGPGRASGAPSGALPAAPAGQSPVAAVSPKHATSAVPSGTRQQGGNAAAQVPAIADSTVNAAGAPGQGTLVASMASPSQCHPATLPEGQQASSLEPVPQSANDTHAAPLADVPHESDGAASPTAAVPATSPLAAGLGDPHGVPDHPGATLDFGINMLLARAFFDVLRNPKSKELMKARFQRKLSLMKIPEYITQIRVADVSLGTSPPQVANCRAVPSPTDVLWPQGYFDFSYQGDLTLTIETSVDIREGTMWNQFDKAMSQLEGKALTKAGRSALGKGPSAGAPDGAGVKDDEDANSSSDEEDEVAGGANMAPDALPDLEPEEQVEAEAAVATAGAVAEVTVSKTTMRGRLMNLATMRKAAAATIRQLADRTADQISRIPLRLTVSILRVSGPMHIWVPPPPSSRLWYSYTDPPEMDIRATPELGSRLLRHPAIATRVSALMERKLRHAFRKNLVFPMCSDLVVPLFMDLDCENVADKFDLPLPDIDPQVSAPVATSASAQAPSGAAAMDVPAQHPSLGNVSSSSQAAAHLSNAAGTMPHAASAPAVPAAAQGAPSVPAAAGSTGPPRSASTTAARGQSAAQQPSSTAPGASAGGDALGRSVMSMQAARTDRPASAAPVSQSQDGRTDRPAAAALASQSQGFTRVPAPPERDMSHETKAAAPTGWKGDPEVGWERQGTPLRSPVSAAGEHMGAVAVRKTQQEDIEMVSSTRLDSDNLRGAGSGQKGAVAGQASSADANTARATGPPKLSSAGNAPSAALAAAVPIVKPAPSPLSLLTGGQLQGTFMSPPGTPAAALAQELPEPLLQPLPHTPSHSDLQMPANVHDSYVHMGDAQAAVHLRAARLAQSAAALGDPHTASESDNAAQPLGQGVTVPHIAASVAQGPGAQGPLQAGLSGASPTKVETVAAGTTGSDRSAAQGQDQHVSIAQSEQSLGSSALTGVQRGPCRDALVPEVDVEVTTLHAAMPSADADGPCSDVSPVPPRTASSGPSVSPRAAWLSGGMAKQISDDISRFLAGANGTREQGPAGAPQASKSSAPGALEDVCAEVARVGPTTGPLRPTVQKSSVSEESIVVVQQVTDGSQSGTRAMSDGAMRFNAGDDLEPSSSEASAASASAPGGALEGRRSGAWVHQRVAITQANSQKLVAGISQAIKTNPHLSQMNQNAKRFTENLKKGIADARLRKNLQQQPNVPVDKSLQDDRGSAAL